MGTFSGWFLSCPSDGLMHTIFHFDRMMGMCVVHSYITQNATTQKNL